MTPSEIIVDNFAGGGGASTGIAHAVGREIDIAINHNAEALAIHAQNHPGTKHYCESVFDVDPHEATKGRPVGLCWLSPDCTHHSKAKGGKPREQGIRGLAWIAVRWAVAVRPRIIMLENVGEFAKWGPLDPDGYPIKSRAGETFRAFVAALSTGLEAGHPALDEITGALGADFPVQHVLNGLGYTVEFRELRACDYGAPTIRKRLFLVARRDGVPITWPEPTHGDPKSNDVRSGQLLPWRTAAECIDFTIPTKSIFGRKKPLAENTLKRIAKGLRQYVLDGGATPFIVDCAHSAESPSGVKRWGDGIRGTDAPLQTVLASGNGSGIVQPFIAKFRGDSGGTAVTEPMPTITGGGNSQRPAGAPHALGVVAASLHAATTGSSGAVEPCPQHAPDARDPRHLSVPTLIEIGYGERPGQAPRVPGLQQPLGTVVAGGGKHALVAAHLVGIDNAGSGASSAWSAEAPVRTITGENRVALVAATVAKFRKDSPGSNPNQPLDVICADAQHHGLLLAHMEQANGGGYAGGGRSIQHPMSTVLGTGSHQQLVTSEAVQITGEQAGSSGSGAASEKLAMVRAFAQKYLGLDRLLTTIHGIVYEVTDIGLRMLKPRELFKAQGFPDGYIIEFTKRDGKPLSISAQVRMCGNSVCPPVAQALVRANLSIPKQRLALAA